MCVSNDKKIGVIEQKKFELENKLGLTVTPIIQINQSPGTKIFKKVTGKKLWWILNQRNKRFPEFALCQI